MHGSLNAWWSAMWSGLAPNFAIAELDLTEEELLRDLRFGRGPAYAAN